MRTGVKKRSRKGGGERPVPPRLALGKWSERSVRVEAPHFRGGDMTVVAEPDDFADTRDSSCRTRAVVFDSCKYHEVDSFGDEAVGRFGRESFW